MDGQHSYGMDSYEVVLGKMLDAKQHTGRHPVAYLRNADVQWDHINTRELPLMDIEPDDLERYTLRRGDLLICEGGAGVGQTAIWNAEISPCAFQKALHRLRPLRSDEFPRFLYYCLRWIVEAGVLFAEGNSTIPHLTNERLRGYRLPKPSLSEQVEIVKHLDQEMSRLDALATEVQRAIDLLQERRAALISL
jgi:type I restriction enzyme, S subunit